MRCNPSEKAGRKTHAPYQGSAGMLWLAMVLLTAGSVLGIPGQTGAQSLSKTAAAPLQAGLNSGSVDSLIGPHYWYFWAQPGHFEVVFSRSAAQGLAASGQASIACGFSPSTTGSHMTVKSSPEGAVYSGTVTQRTRVGMAISPPNSMLIRSTVSYTVAASGDVGFDSAKDAGATVAGVYTQMNMISGAPPLGAVRFNADGTIETANGQTGTWKLFDKDSSTYVVVLGGQRQSLHFDPGRGFFDMRGGISFSRAH